jgi:hypothetical protein
MESDQLLPWRYACRTYLHTSATTAWRRERSDPEFRALKVQIGPGRFGARLSAIQAYIASRPPAQRSKKSTRAARRARRRVAAA